MTRANRLSSLWLRYGSVAVFLTAGVLCYIHSLAISASFAYHGGGEGSRVAHDVQNVYLAISAVCGIVTAGIIFGLRDEKSSVVYRAVISLAYTFILAICEYGLFLVVAAVLHLLRR